MFFLDAWESRGRMLLAGVVACAAPVAFLRTAGLEQVGDSTVVLETAGTIGVVS